MNTIAAARRATLVSRVASQLRRAGFEIRSSCRIDIRCQSGGSWPIARSNRTVIVT